MSVRSTLPTPKVVGAVTTGHVATFVDATGARLQDGGAPGAGTVTHTGTLTAHAVMLGNGGADIIALGSLGTSGQVLTSNGAGSDPSFQSGSAGTVTHTGTLTAHAIMLGNGGADILALGSLGTSGQILTSNGAGSDPSFQTAAAAADYVVLSNGANPPTPVDDGNGNFIYVTYTP